MNERIEALAEQCYHRYSENNINLVKFTRLLLQECSAVLESHDPDFDWAGVVLKKHFGVE